VFDVIFQLETGRVIRKADELLCTERIRKDVQERIDGHLEMTTRRNWRFPTMKLVRGTSISNHVTLGNPERVGAASWHSVFGEAPVMFRTPFPNLSVWHGTLSGVINVVPKEVLDRSLFLLASAHKHSSIL
jgi:hypothetical protein